ncbi:hypothetical protein PO878_21595 [Iamia majanohamensis]|uniref:Uncharacterized protein n=1 Tax=Iamia majanohamensis TaxID=467976 RepID=A0AAF0BRP9_9ACTN|nr:hypothetical protein [Iamia majanohamensis]WCO67086.1 hypothetical protein PO878_21595 [Iamia majanohamensis]
MRRPARVLACVLAALAVALAGYGVLLWWGSSLGDLATPRARLIPVFAAAGITATGAAAALLVAVRSGDD